MPTPATSSWHHQIDALRNQMEDLCTGLTDAPVTERLHALHLLRTTFFAIHDDALTEAVTAARDAGWGLRRIGTAIGLSHEQVRKMTLPRSADSPKTPDPHTP
ncbi:hypothetical protein ACIRSF_33685 [Streptomyces rubiginosohelvolus]|uniref:hypothetical protein n=1 Tax=Streptomyces rubiginosohelvolus TaxID=67362 RepID=UPI00382D1A47